MSRVKLILSYDGTSYCGWQKQKEHAFGPDLPSIQETLEIGLSKILQQKISVSASGRTDAGVHAMAQVAHFDVDGRLPKDLCWAMRSFLPSDIAVKAAFIAPDEFHSTLSAEKKIYRYWLWNRPRATALLHRYTWWLRQELDLKHLNQLACALIGEQDFESFRSMGTPVRTSVRHIYSARWSHPASGVLQFEVCGDGFMKQMVRNLVGTQVGLAQKSANPAQLIDIIKARDRNAAGATAPPQGLFLRKVYYPKDLDIRCRQI